MLCEYWMWNVKRGYGAPCVPFGEDEEELVYESGSHSVGVELAGPGYQHGPGDSTQEAQHVGVDPTAWGTGRGAQG